jgi:peptidoglycan pentaglycine glycine transferase (the first glycine)
MEARFITDKQQWNDFVAKSPYGNITQTFEWGELSKDVGSHFLRVGVVDDQNNLCAVMLVLVVKVPMLHSSFFYAPRGPIVDDPNSPAISVLLNFVKSEARKLGVFMLKLEPGVDAGDTRWISTLERRGFRPSTQFLHIRNEWILDIRPSEKDILANMKEKWRYNIRLATRKGVTIREGHGREDLETFHRILQETAERDQFYIHDVASSSQGRNFMPNHLLQWTGMQWAKARGCEYYNFLGIPNSLEEPEAQNDPLWGVYTFKRGFNGFSRLSLPGYDLPYNPLLYQTYKKMLELKSWRAARKNKKESQPEEKDAEKQKVQKVAEKVTVPVSKT